MKLKTRPQNTRLRTRPELVEQKREKNFKNIFDDLGNGYTITPSPAENAGERGTETTVRLVKQAAVFLSPSDGSLTVKRVSEAAKANQTREKQKLNCALHVNCMQQVDESRFGHFSWQFCQHQFLESLILAQNERWRRG